MKGIIGQESFWGKDGSGGRALARAAAERMGFLDSEQLRAVAEDGETALEMVLVRWHEGRALVSANQAAALIAATDRGGWTLRDVCIPATRCDVWRARYRRENGGAK